MIERLLTKAVLTATKDASEFEVLANLVDQVNKYTRKQSSDNKQSLNTACMMFIIKHQLDKRGVDAVMKIIDQMHDMEKIKGQQPQYN